MALNAPTGTNNLLALAATVAATGRGDAGYADTGEPTLANSAAGTVTKTATFPVNGAGNQPTVARGGYALLVKTVDSGTTVQAITIYASDGTAGHDEVLDIYPANTTAARGVCMAKPFNSSLAAGADVGTITNVVSLKAVVVLSGGNGATIGFAAVGTP
jgi:hypothetical protein